MGKFGTGIRERLRELQKKKSPEKKIETIQKIFHDIFGEQKVYLFVSPYASDKLASYQSYLSKSEKNLINILDSYSGIESYDKDLMHMVKKVFYGAVDVSKQSNEEINLQKVSENDVVSKISDTWANDYSDKYCVVRLTEICELKIKSYDENKENKISIMENDPVWFRPTGCIVVENSSMSYRLHMEISRTILSIGNYITSYVKKEFSYGVIREAIQKRVLNQEYKNILSNINHSVKEYLNIKAISEFKMEKISDPTLEDLRSLIVDIRIYAFGLRHLSSIAELEIGDTSCNENVYNIFYNSSNNKTRFFKNLNKFVKVAHEFLPSKFSKIVEDISVIDNSNGHYIGLDIGYNKIEHMAFEIIFNALKCHIDDDFQEVKIEFTQNGIIFRNKLSKKDKDEAIKKIKGEMENKGGFGMATIRRMLKRQKGMYVLDAIYEDSSSEILTIIKYQGEK